MAGESSPSMRIYVGVGSQATLGLRLLACVAMDACTARGERGVVRGRDEGGKVKVNGTRILR